MKISDLLQKYGVLIAFLILFAANAILEPEIFLKPENLRNLISQNVPVGIVAIGMTLVIVAGGIDLTAGSLFALAGASGLTILNSVMKGSGNETQAAIMGCVACIGAGTLLGAWNGLLIAYGRITPFVATLIGLVGFRSLCLALAEGGEVRSESPNIFPSIQSQGIPLNFIDVGNGRPLMINWTILIFAVCALIGGWILNRTRFGRYAIAIGSNERAAKYSALPVKAVTFWVYVLMGAFTGIASITYAAKLNSVTSSSMGLYYELDAIAGVVIGGTSLKGGSGRIWGTVVGVLLLGLITNMLVILKVPIYWQGVVKGLVILVAVLIQRGKAES